ncbi:pilus assembly protein TadG-related protein [Pseudomonas fluorescens]|uniref:pilus assembly protein TadG-related protein n=1 Tax=Pseudomonas fluorescens TaxID=294 RepID=UPI001BE72155|nr:pilus assembly protein TadG-related protein [Pseudomonas fluorescens]MBT2375117.1 hypothetical protein [Pseudomonas fluorescens]
MSPPLEYSRQRGVIGLMAAGTLALALVCMLLVVDSGRLYLEKRKLQSIADTSALEAAGRGGQCATNTTASDYATQNATRNGFTVAANDNSRGLAVTCGTLATNASNLRVFSADASRNDAIRVVASRTVATSVVNGVRNLFSGTPLAAQMTLSATAVAALPPPVAALTIRSTAFVVDSSKSIILNSLFAGLLGGSLNISAAGWNGLINADISLLSYLNQLKIDLGLTAVGYSQVLGNTIRVSQLIQSAINVLDPTHTLGATVTIASLQALSVAAGTTQVVLGNVLQIASGSDVSALAVNMRVFDLIQGFVQLANKTNGLVASFPIDLPGLAQISAKVQVLQPPQMSAIGNPAKAVASGQNPQTGPNRIYVQTAQLRVLLSIGLPVLDSLAPLKNAVTGLVGPLTSTLSSLLHLNLVGVIDGLTCLLGASCTMPDLQILPPPLKVDVALNAANGSSWVTGYSCANPSNKSLTTNATTALATLKVGNIDPSSVFGNSQTPPQIQLFPIKLVDIGTMTCRRLLILNDCSPRVPSVGGGIALSVDTKVAANANASVAHTYVSPGLLDIGQPPLYYAYVAANPVTSLSDTVTGVNIQMYGPTPGNSNLLGELIGGLGSILNSVSSLLVTTIKTVLGPLLDTVLDTLLHGLGINVNQVDVGANLSCHAGRAYLVI